MNNPWHDVSIGNDCPHIVQAIIEIPSGSRAKYEREKDSGLLRLYRVLYSSVHIPQTLGDDHDPLDILVISRVEVQPLCIVRAKVLGVMRMVDSGEGDDKIIAVAADDVSVNHVNSIRELPAYFHSELRHFFEEYKTLENKTVLVEDFQDENLAKEIIQTAISAYQKHFSQ